MRKYPTKSIASEYLLETQQYTFSYESQRMSDFSYTRILQDIIRARISLEDKLARILANKLLPNLVKKDWVTKIIESGADVCTRNHVSLRWAAEHGYLDLVKLTVDKGSDVHCLKDEPLSRAALNGHVDVVRFLIENQADIHAKDDVALRLASSAGHEDIVKLLLKQGANPCTRNNEATRKAFDGGHFIILKALLQTHAKTILDFANDQEDWQIFAIAWQYAKSVQDENVLDILSTYEYRPSAKRVARQLA